MFTIVEQIILNNIDKKYSWIARDKDGWLYIYKNKPLKSERYESWSASASMLRIDIFEHIFKEVKWEDEEPTKIEREPLDYNLIELINMYQAIKGTPLCDSVTIKLSKDGVEKHEPVETVKNKETGLNDLVMRPKIPLIRDIFGEKAPLRLDGKIFTKLPSSNKPIHRAKRIVDNQIKKSMESYGTDIEDCNLSVKELLDNALEKNADAMICLAKLRERLFGNENE